MVASLRLRGPWAWRLTGLCTFAVDNNEDTIVEELRVQHLEGRSRLACVIYGNAAFHEGHLGLDWTLYGVRSVM